MKRNIVSILFIVIVLLALFVMSIWSQGENFSNDLEKMRESEAQFIPWGISLINPNHINDYLSEIPIRVAIIDSGIDATHPDLDGKVVSQYNAVDDRDYIGDSTGHGTADNQERVGNGIPIITD